MIQKTKRSDNTDSRKINKIFYEFGVKDEDGLLRKLARESLTIPCIMCKCEYDFEQLKFIHGDPYCKHCYSDL